MTQATAQERSETAIQPRVQRPLWAMLLRNHRARLGLGIILTLYLVALLAPVLAPHDPNAQVLIDRLQAPSLKYPLGTDTFGRDMLSRAIWAARISLGVSLAAVSVSISLGSLIGLVSGYFGGFVDSVLMRLTDLMLAFPSFILLITLVAIYGSSLPLIVVFLGLSAWHGTARLVRAEVLSLRTRDFVLAARIVGASSRRIIAFHLLPNVVALIVVAATLQVAGLILVEAALSFFGLGVQPPAASWGNMVADGQTLLDTAWWVSAVPGLLIMLTVVAYNLLGDGLRDVFDPRRSGAQN